MAEAQDTRLAPDETRRFTYPIPSGAARVEARLVSRRLPAAVAARLGLADHEAAQPVVMTVVARNLPEASPDTHQVTEPSGS